MFSKLVCTPECPRAQTDTKEEGSRWLAADAGARNVLLSPAAAAFRPGNYSCAASTDAAAGAHTMMTRCATADLPPENFKATSRQVYNTPHMRFLFLMSRHFSRTVKEVLCTELSSCFQFSALQNKELTSDYSYFLRAPLTIITFAAFTTDFGIE